MLEPKVSSCKLHVLFATKNFFLTEISLLKSNLQKEKKSKLTTLSKDGLNVQLFACGKQKPLSHKPMLK